MSLAYLLNWYPMPSQTALRREVAALDELGIPFHRFSLRRYEGELVDEDDQAERERTRAVLDVGARADDGGVANQRDTAMAICSSDCDGRPHRSNR